MNIKKIVEIVSFSVLLVGSFVLGFMGNTAEMGLAISAGAIGLAFINIEQIASLKGAGIELVTKEKIQAIIEKETEPSYIKVEAYGTDDDTKKVIAALKNPKYTWRYSSGLVKETGLNKQKVTSALAWLADNQLGILSKGENGNVWSLTQKGREVFGQVNG